MTLYATSMSLNISTKSCLVEILRQRFIQPLEPTCNMTLRGASYRSAKIKNHMRSNIFLVASLVATIALLAVIMQPATIKAIATFTEAYAGNTFLSKTAANADQIFPNNLGDAASRTLHVVFPGAINERGVILPIMDRDYY